MKKVIKVEIGYYDFTFKSLSTAQDFADAAAGSCDKNTRVRLTVDYEDEEEEQEDEV